MVDHSPTDPAVFADDGVRWLFDPAVDDDLDGPLTCGPDELYGLLTDALCDAGLVEVAVTGVVSGLRRRSRWCSFELLELTEGVDSPVATVRCVMFARAMASIDAALRRAGAELCNGALVTASGSLQWHRPWGELRVVVDDVTVADQRSAAAEATALLVERLAASGDMDRQAALAVPARPVRVGVLTGAGTAGAADVRTVLEASGIDWDVVWRSVPMAGPDAAAGVAVGVAALAEARVDVIVVARGGGAAGEMGWANSEVVAAAVAACPVPVWTAIGHATDHSVADLVANRSWQTPSAAANALVALVTEDDHRRRAVAVSRTHRVEVAELAGRARVAWVALAIVVVVVLALLFVG